MDISNLGEDRFLRKDPSQSDQTKDAVYASLNPVPKRGNDDGNKIGRPKGSEEDGGAPNVLTGTVIVSCFIQTSALPSRIEMQGNDLTFFDDSIASNGVVTGDTSRLIFTHASGKRGEVVNEGFVIEKRASEIGTYDNVLSWYAYPARSGSHNFIFIGRDGHFASPKPNVQSITFGVDQDSSFDPGINNPVNGVLQVEFWKDSVFLGRPLSAGSSKTILGSGFDGYSAFVIGGRGGVSGIAYEGVGAGIYMKSESEVTLGLDLIPDTDATYDIGSASFQIKDLYISGTIHGGGGTKTSWGGRVDANAVAANLPTGWSASKVGTIYTITHNLGTANYQPVFYVGSFALWGILQGALGVNSFSVDFENSTGSAFSTDWGFNLALI